MPVPDLTPYVSLVIDDRTAQDLFNEFLADAQSRLSADLVETNPAVVYAQSYQLTGAEIIFAINRLPGAVMEALGTRGYQLPRGQGTPPIGAITFAVSDLDGHTLDAGTRVGVVGPDGVLATFTTDVDSTVAPGDPTGTVTVTADQVGSLLNGTPDGTVVQVLDSVPFLDTVTLTGPLTGGTDPETSEPYLTRLAALLQRQVLTVVTPSQFNFAALEVQGVGRAFAIDLYDLGTDTPDSPGFVTVVLTDAAGAAVSSGVKAAVTALLDPIIQGGLIVGLADPTVTAVDVSVTISHDTTISDADASAAVADALTAYLSPASWPFAATVFVTELEFIARSVPGVTLATVTTPVADLPLTGIGPLADAGTLLVTVA